MMDIAKKFDRKRRLDGFLLGLATGLLYGLVSQGINSLFLGEISFYQPPLGPIGNALLWAAGGGALGLAASWAGGSLFGVMVGSLLAGLMILGSALLGSNLRSNMPIKVVGLIGFYFPFVAMTVPLLGLLRIAANQQREWYELAPWAWKRLRMPAILLLSAAGLGALSLFPVEGRQELSQVNQMIRSGLSASLAQPLRDPLVGSFSEKASPTFTLELDHQDLTRYQIPYVPIGEIRPGVVVARFSTGWTLACLYIDPNLEPFCRGIDHLENFLAFGQDEKEIFTDHGFYLPKP